MIAAALFILALQTHPTSMLTIHVEPDRQFTRENTITISPQTQIGPRNAAERDQAVFVATRKWDGGEQSMTSEECPAVARVVALVGNLPPVPVAPPSRSIVEGSAPLPPTIKDGFMTTLSLRTLNADGSHSDISIRGGTAYQAWGTEVVNALIGCWGPITP